MDNPSHISPHYTEIQFLPSWHTALSVNALAEEEKYFIQMQKYLLTDRQTEEVPYLEIAL